MPSVTEMRPLCFVGPADYTVGIYNTQNRLLYEACHVQGKSTSPEMMYQDPDGMIAFPVLRSADGAQHLVDDSAPATDEAIAGVLAGENSKQ